MERDPLTPEQIERWKDLVFQVHGETAYLLSDEDVEELRDHLQDLFNQKQAGTLKDEISEDELYGLSDGELRLLQDLQDRDAATLTAAEVLQFARLTKKLNDNESEQ